MARRRIEDHGTGLHVIQLAGCEARWMAEGARIAQERRAGRFGNDSVRGSCRRRARRRATPRADETVRR
jgi:hypothetical protein